MYFFSSSLTVALTAFSLGSSALPNPTTRSSLTLPVGLNKTVSNEDRAAAVKEAFTSAWNGYYKYCFGQDELHPVTNTCGNSRNGWGASAVDALSTALVMQIPDIVNEIVQYIPTIDFSRTSTEVSLFETTIRYLGGMLSGYDLLKGPLSSLANDTSNVDALLTQARKLADVLKYSFNTRTGIPSNGLNISQKTTDGSTVNGLATLGTLVLEWTRLSDLTGEPEYAQLTQKAESYLLRPQNPALGEPFPGLLGTGIDINSGNFTDSNGGWSGGDDSFYEYLLKMYVYDTSRFGAYKDRWIAAADSTIKFLASHPSSRPDLTFLAQYRGTDLVFSSQHLTCFDGGNFLLGGEVLKRQDYIEFGLALVNGCHATYISTATGIGPEVFSWNTTALPPTQAAFYQKNGFWIQNGNYITRPEVIESYYHAYRITGNPMYRDWAWDAFVAINATTRTSTGFSSISNVNVFGGGQKFDNQESFLFAEVLKYAYLIFAPDDVWQVAHNGVNEWVFNTEAHPFKVAGPPV